MKRSLDVSATRRVTVIAALINRLDLRHGAGALVLLVLALCSAGCGSSDKSGTGGAQETAKGEARYRYEGTGRNKQKVLIRRRDERIKKLQEAAQKQG